MSENTQQLNALNRGRCPDCGGTRFHEGPHGSGSVNVKCAGCGSKFCYQAPFTPDRINNEDICYDAETTTIQDLTRF
jgi:DNA-directed RNA polymerase subunit RPC12/RpoP